MTEHQKIMLEMLREIDRICRKHDIPYQLFAGTALGAVRHGGFIPWDDDLDIIMLRKDYLRFLSLAERELNSDLYALQAEFTDHWPMFFSKLRRNNTTCFERFIPKDLQSHQGIYVDIFPCDNLSDNKILRLMQFLSSKIVIAKSLDQRGYRTDNPMKKLFLLLCRALPSEPFHRFTVSSAAADSEMVHCFFAAASKFRKSIFPRSWLEESTLLPFEDGTFPVSVYSDELLTSLYGDYHKLPAQQEIEAKIHAFFVDTERSYEHYLELQKTMELRGYSRSIR